MSGYKYNMRFRARSIGAPQASNPSKSGGVTVDFDTLKPMSMRQFFAAGKKPSSDMGGDLKKVIADRFFDRAFKRAEYNFSLRVL